MRLRLAKGRLLVRRSPAATQTKSGLALPDAARDRSQTGTIVATGRGSDLAVGSLVLLPIYHMATIRLDGESLVHINETEVLALFEDVPRLETPSQERTDK